MTNSPLFALVFALGWITFLPILGYSTYHAYFFKMLPIIIFHAAILGFVVANWLPAFWSTQMWMSLIIMVLIYRRNNRLGQIMLERTGPSDRSLVYLSQRSSMAYYALTCGLNLMTFFMSFALIFNASIK